MICRIGVVCRGTTPSHELSEPRRQFRAAIGHTTVAPMRAKAAVSHRFLRLFSCLQGIRPIRLDRCPPHICVTIELNVMSVIMEQQGTSTSTISNIQIPGVPSDASILNSLRNVFRPGELHKRSKSAIKAPATGVRVKVDVPTSTATVREPSQARGGLQMDTNEWKEVFLCRYAVEIFNN